MRPKMPHLSYPWVFELAGICSASSRDCPFYQLIQHGAHNWQGKENIELFM
jgi:hypothetical protein